MQDTQRRHFKAEHLYLFFLYFLLLLRGGSSNCLFVPGF